MSRSLISVRDRRVRVLLASGLILGVGAVGTLAAWTDTVDATGAFSASTFGIELNVNGSWNDGPEMTFSTDQLYPGAVTYAQVLVRTTGDTDLDAELTLRGNGSPETIMNALSYRVVSDIVPEYWAPEGWTPPCDARRFEGSPAYVFDSSGSGVAMSSHSTAESSQRVSAAGADYAAYCFEVTLSTDAPSSLQGHGADHTWTWDAVSVSTEEAP